ncbi:MAG: patatin-like phospholipase family protein [Patescibacteria group bacterium]
MTKKNLKIGLALSGGGAKGFAHIGAIKELEKLGLSFYCLAGTSMGALVGAWYAAGKDFKILEEIARKKQWRKFLSIRKVIGSVKDKGGLFSLDQFEAFLSKHLGQTEIEDLGIKFCAVATSLKTGKELRLSKGNLKKAVLASSCLPIVFTPIENQGDLLVDGGIVNNFPVDACFEMGADIVIGVDVRSHHTEVERAISQERYLLHWKIFQVLNALMGMMGGEKDEKYQSIENLIVIKPYVSHITTFEFGRVDEIEKLGQEAFDQKEKEIRGKLGLPPKQVNWWEKLLGE